jgi:hypothetical protein
LLAATLKFAPLPFVLLPGFSAEDRRFTIQLAIYDFALVEEITHARPFGGSHRTVRNYDPDLVGSIR